MYIFTINKTSIIFKAVEFHLHLDECIQCSSEPFNLCPKGLELLEKAIKK